MQLGECRFCHQMVKVDLPADSSEEERNEEATKICGCDKAERYRAIQTGIENASACGISVGGRISRMCQAGSRYHQSLAADSKELYYGCR